MSEYTWDDVCLTENCTHDNLKCGAWEELHYMHCADTCDNSITCTNN